VRFPLKKGSASCDSGRKAPQIRVRGVTPEPNPKCIFCIIVYIFMSGMFLFVVKALFKKQRPFTDYDKT
jgi:hypothetical protein